MDIFPALYDVVDMALMLIIAVPSAYVAGVIREKSRKRPKYELPR